MTDHVKDGGLAFPHLNPNYDGNWDKEPQRGGMTLRDYFAGQIAAAMIPTIKGSHERHEAWSVIAEWSYELADAMLAERERK